MKKPTLFGICLFAALSSIAVASDGEIDTTFNRIAFSDDGTHGFGLNAVATTKSGAVYAAGLPMLVDGVQRRGLYAFSPKGILKTSFVPQRGSDGASFLDVAVQSDGKVLATSDEFLVQRFLASGKIDPKFATPLQLDSGTARRVLVLADKRILVAGDFAATDGNGKLHRALVRLLPSGELDPGFFAEFEDGSYVSDLQVSSEGQIYFCGFLDLTEPDGAGFDYAANVGRLDGGGQPDNFYIPESSYDLGFATSLGLQADGRLLVGYGSGAFGIDRLQQDGSLDSSWNIAAFEAEFSGSRIQSIVPQADGKVLVGGDFTCKADVTRHHLARVNYDGQRDGTWAGYAGNDGVVNDIQLLPKGKVHVAGSFEQVDGQDRPALVRLTGNPGAGWIIPEPGPPRNPKLSKKFAGSSLPFLTGWYYVTSYTFQDGFVPKNSFAFCYLDGGTFSGRITKILVPDFDEVQPDPFVQKLGTGATHFPTLAQLTAAAEALPHGTPDLPPVLSWAPGTVFETIVNEPGIIAFKANGYLADFTNDIASNDGPAIALVPGGPYKAIPGTPSSLGSNVGQMYDGNTPYADELYRGTQRVLQFVTARKNGVQYFIAMFLISELTDGTMLSLDDLPNNDTTPPKVTVKFPAKNQKVSSDTVVIGGTVTEKGWVDSVEWRTNNGSWQPAYGGPGWSATATGLTPGPNQIEIRARDGAGNLSNPPTRINILRL